ncbi:winged helix-turn-helix domain-containing protein [Fundidesulfovibrio butyratiphilus]
MKILLIEDDAETASYVSEGLKEHGHVVDYAPDGLEGLLMASSASHDVMVVDRMLPGLDGVALVKAARSAGVKTPILFLTTLGGIDDRVEGLNAGGDDYLGKPFAFSELLARVNALARRPPLAEVVVKLQVADLEIDLLTRTATRAGTALDLKPMEFKLLEYLARNAGRVVTKTMLLEQVWEFHFDPQTNVVETNISRLRSKVDKDFATELIHTVRGAGYILREPH